MSNATQAALRARSREQAGKGSATFGGIDKSAARPGHGQSDFRTIQESRQFVELRSRVKRFVFPMSAVFLLWYMTYVVLADYAHDFMATPVFGEINVGILMGIGQFVSTVVITSLYVRFASRTIDPGVDEIRQNAEGTNP